MIRCNLSAGVETLPTVTLPVCACAYVCVCVGGDTNEIWILFIHIIIMLFCKCLCVTHFAHTTHAQIFFPCGTEVKVSFRLWVPGQATVDQSRGAITCHTGALTVLFFCLFTLATVYLSLSLSLLSLILTSHCHYCAHTTGEKWGQVYTRVGTLPPPSRIFQVKFFSILLFPFLPSFTSFFFFLPHSPASLFPIFPLPIERQIDRQTDGQADRETERASVVGDWFTIHNPQSVHHR